MKILNPAKIISIDQVAVSASIPPPLPFFLQPSPFSSKCLGPVGPNISTTDNMIFIIIISFCFYMSTQNKWQCLLASPPRSPFWGRLGPSGPNLKFKDQLEEFLLMTCKKPYFSKTSDTPDIISDTPTNTIRH